MRALPPVDAYVVLDLLMKEPISQERSSDRETIVGSLMKSNRLNETILAEVIYGRTNLLDYLVNKAIIDANWRLPNNNLNLLDLSVIGNHSTSFQFAYSHLGIVPSENTILIAYQFRPGAHISAEIAEMQGDDHLKIMQTLLNDPRLNLNSPQLRPIVRHYSQLLK